MDEGEMEKKLAEIRGNVSEKLNKWADKIIVSMAYTPKIERREGERFTENGKTFVMKNGVKQSVSLMEEARMPHWCPRCSKAMNHRFDRKFYYLRGWCFNCNVDIEGEMRVNGTFEAYERKLCRANEVSWIKDKIEQHLTYIKEFKEPTVYFENGGYEVIAKKEEFQATFDVLLKDVEFLTKRLEVIQAEEEAELANEQGNSVIEEPASVESIETKICDGCSNCGCDTDGVLDGDVQ
jgi:hypothetical protein